MNRYEGDFPKLSKSNSISFNGMLFYFKKVDGCCVAFEYKTKIQINHSFEKEVLIEWLSNNTERINNKLKEIK